ncbi:MAG: response regulator [Bacteroidota bacterium]
MLKKWLLNLKIRHKLSLMTVVAVLNLAGMGLVAHYFFNTSRVIAVIFNAERLHTLSFQSAMGNFYRYLQTQDTTDLNHAFKQMDRANEMADVFGKTPEFIKQLSKQELEEVYFRVLGEAMNNDRDFARLFTSRVYLLFSLGNKGILNSFEIASKGAENGFRIKRMIQVYIQQPDPVLLKEIDDAIMLTNQYYKEFAQSIEAVSEWANRLLLVGIILITLLLSMVVIFLSNYISGFITSAVRNITEGFAHISRGNLKRRIDASSKDEMGQLGQAFNKLQDALSLLVDQTRQVASGDFTVKIEPRSEEDEFSKSLIVMIESLSRADKAARREAWFKNGQNEINELLRGDQTEEEISDKVVAFLARYLNAQSGAVYLLGDSGRELILKGSYAFVKRKSLSDRFAIGEGIVGQVAKSRKMISITNLPEDYTRITSATGDTKPRNVVAFPLLHNNQLAGVIELASIEEFDDDRLAFIETVAENIAISILSSISRRKLAELLATTQQQAEELQTQQEELRVANEELEEQTRVLREREAELQAQQEELRVINEELEANTQYLEMQKREVMQKNAELAAARDELERKARELEITSKYKSEFLANMSHELRTPLNSLLILSNNLLQNKQGNLTPQQLESVQIIRKSGNDLLNLINEILDLSKIESGKMTLNFEQVDIRQIADNIDKQFRHLAEEKKLNFKVEIEPGTPESLITDPLRFEQVLRNLLSNAIKFTDKGQVAILFSLAPANFSYRRQDLRGKSVLQISVADTGIGIPKEKQQIIFEAFQQADGSTSRKFGGTGLGLSISREIVKIFGGEIHLESEPGKGSTFSVFIPIETMPAPSVGETIEPNILPEEPEVIMPVKIDTSSINLDECRSALNDDRDNLSPNDRIILVVEDDENFAAILRDECHEKGFKFLYACTGEIGLKMAEVYLPDAIILDIRLPGADGITVLDHIKRNPDLRHIPVHMMSALEESLDIFQKGAIGYLSKPATPEKMEAAFANIETFVTRKVRELLVVEDNPELAKQIADIVGREDVNTVIAGTGKHALELLRTQHFDCVVLDLGLPDMTGFDLLETLKKEMPHGTPPIIIYTGRELTREENNKLRKYAESIIVKGVKSEERLLDETSLFLHRVVKNLPKNKQEVIENLYKKDAALAGKKVLIVDDDMRNLYALSIVLDEKGMKILEAENGEVALKTLEENPDIDIVLMDIMMPVMDGLETIRRIRRMPGFGRLPIIALTAKAMKDDYDKCLAAGASDYLSKPIDIDRLINLMNVWLYK